MTAAACPLCSRIAAGLGRPVCPLCHGAAAITLGPIATTDVMAHAVAIAIRRGVDSVLADVDADPAVNATDALEHLAAGLIDEGYLAHPDDVEAVDITGDRLILRGDPVALDDDGRTRLPWSDPAANPMGDLLDFARRAADRPL